MNIVVVMWNSYVSLLDSVCADLPWVRATLYGARDLDADPARLAEAVERCKGADLILLHRSSEPFWESLEREIGRLEPKKPCVCLSYDPAFWTQSTVPLPVVQQCYNYFILGGRENMAAMLSFLGREALGLSLEAAPPVELPWEGLTHPAAEVGFFPDVASYLAWYEGYARDKGLPAESAGSSTVAVLLSRFYWVNRQTAIEDRIIAELEGQGLRVLPLFSHGVRDTGLGSKGPLAFLEECLLAPDSPKVAALVKLSMFFLGRFGGTATEGGNARDGVDLFTRLGVPVFQPAISNSMSPAQWEESPQGLGLDVSWTVAMPEFEGGIEPLYVGGPKRTEASGAAAQTDERIPMPERCARLARRVARWAAMGQKPVAERKVAFILHNNPCASVEATVGGGVHLDTLESVARVLKTMREAGYQVEVPADGKELITTIMERKAVSEFRWTTVDEIVKKGGALALLPVEEYRTWWDTFPAGVRGRMAGTWGNPPGEAVDGVPPAMVHEGKIVITGVTLGHAVVCVQPKRGCAGSRCDGVVCKILHDPDVPPPHQYLATYRWIEDGFGADVLVHVGTHGNVEFLPGKGVGLSESCLPNLSIHEIPHLYIYNSDNPPEGTIAKRRSLAVLVDHMQTVLVQGGLYGDLEELDRLLGEYEQALVADKAREAFEADPAEFAVRSEAAQVELAARRLLPSVRISEALVQRCAELALQANSAGHRADITLRRTALALAALSCRAEVTARDVEEAADYVLIHRARPAAPPPPPPEEGHEHEHEHDHPDEPDQPEESPDESEASQTEDQDDQGQAEAEDAQADQEAGEDQPRDMAGTPSQDSVAPIGEPFRVRPLSLNRDRIPRVENGRRTRSRTSLKSGRYVKSCMNPESTDLALDATLRAAAPYQRIRNRDGMALAVALSVERSDLRQRVREKRVGNLIVFVVDASGSMNASARMAATKGAILSLLLDAYQKRDRVALVAFRGQEADVLLPPTSSVEMAYNYLEELPTGGRTPLAHGLALGHSVLTACLRKDPSTYPVLVLISDGRANVAMAGGKPLAEALDLATFVGQDQRIRSLVIDVEKPGMMTFGLAREICDHLGGKYFRIDELKAEALVGALKQMDNL